MNNELEVVAEKLKLNEWNVEIFKNGREASDFVAKMCFGKRIGMGDSHTIKEIGLLDKFLESNEELYACQLDKSRENKLKSLNSEVFLLSVNAVAMDTGEMVNVDSSCNRIAPSLYGPEEVIFIVGRNKIEKDLSSAIYRARNIAAPINAKIHNYNTPCVITGKCENCYTKDRICRATVIYHKRPKPMKGTVILINEDLGF